MALETETDVEEVRRVQDENGSTQAPANEKRQKEISESVTNADTVEQFVHSTDGDTPEALPSHAVPDGISVLVEWAEGNSGNVYVGGSETQQAPLTQVGDGRIFPVTDTSAIHVRTPTAGDAVVVTFEGDA